MKKEGIRFNRSSRVNEAHLYTLRLGRSQWTPRYSTRAPISTARVTKMKQMSIKLSMAGVCFGKESLKRK
jgi:hypothetical protein